MEGQIKNLNGVTKFTSRNVDKTSRLRQKYESIITEVNENSQTYEKNFTKLQNLILMEGIPSETEVSNERNAHIKLLGGEKKLRNWVFFTWKDLANPTSSQQR